jgi:subtilisin-like proprotein convertase family protein
MRLESRTWFLLSLIFFAGAIYFWKRGEEYQKSKAVPPQKQSVPKPSAGIAPAPAPFQLLSSQSSATAAATVAGLGAVTAPSGPVIVPAAEQYPHRLANATKTMSEWTRADTAVLMLNAFIDTSAGAGSLPIPEHLRAEEEPASYIVQARGTIGQGFRERLRQVGATFISYIPNNACLVRVSVEGARRLRTFPELQAVLPYEPYYKLDSKLIKLAVEQEPLAEDALLRVTGFLGERDNTAQAVAGVGAEVLGEDTTPFGPQLLVKPPVDSWAALAKLASVQTVELFHRRELMADQTRVIIGLTGSGSSETNYLNLTGTNIMVNVTDTGVDANHPDLQGRVIGDTSRVLNDPFAHGTHVAGILAGSGAQSSTVQAAPSGSITNASFRGIAPGAQLFVLPYESYPLVNRFLDDTYIFEAAARTNLLYSKRGNGPMVSNNSWGYAGVSEYDSSSARFDAAVRDALPEASGSQPMIFVFAAGNSGEGSDTGQLGDPNSIPSPANAKNVITVGASELLRFITNGVLVTNLDETISTNSMFLGMTDANDQIAAFSGRGNVGIGAEGEFGRFKPDVVAPGAFIVAPRSQYWELESQYDTNSTEYGILKAINDPLGPSYRVESGTSQAAPVVSGMLALMQEFFEQRLPAGLRRTNSPAMMKALLINGARSLGALYDLEVQNSINYQGWGLANITNTLPAAMVTASEGRWPIRMIDQTPTNALATGQSKSWNLTLSTNAQDAPLRITLVWTDPPGNPAAAIKLVNDLDLVVSNTVSGEIFYGNDIRTASDFNRASSVEEPEASDFVNNVENVFIRTPGTSNLVVTIKAKRVNVSATANYNQVTGQPNDIVQDYALVITCADPTIPAPFTLSTVANPETKSVQAVNMTNGVPLLNQRAGANSPLGLSQHGTTSQWNFFVFTNLYVTNDVSTMTNGTNVAFITFLPPNASRPRNESADLDLYVSKDPRLVDLDPGALNTAWRSLTRTGTEYVVFTNANLGDIYYIGVKAEDQQAAEYGLIALSSDQPFEEDKDGKKVLNGMPAPQVIPDGTPADPGHTTIFAIGITPITVKKAVVTDVLTHEDVGDLSLILTHERNSVVLHNHTLNNGFFSGTNMVFTYDDQSFGNYDPSHRRSDGPGSLNDFAGSQSTGVWMLNAVDNAPSKVGRVESLTIELEPFVNGDLNAAGAAGINGTVGPGDAACYFVDVPPEATNLLVAVSQIASPLVLYLSHGSLPDTNTFDKVALISPPGAVVTLGANDEPIPLQAGRYFVCLYNPGASPVSFHLVASFELGVGLDFQRTLVGTNAVTIPDNGLITATVNVPVDKQVAEVQVAVRIDHPRSSDLVLHLISPQGTRVLLAENRGGTEERGFGAGYGTNLTYSVFTENTNFLKTLAPIKFALPPWTNLVTSTNPPVFSNSFEGAEPWLYMTNESFAGWAVTHGLVELHGPGNALGVPARNGTNFVELGSTYGPGSIMTSFGTVPGKQYELSFFFQRNPGAILDTAHALQLYYGEPLEFRSPVKFIEAPGAGWQSTSIVFTASSPQTQLEFGALTSSGPLIDEVMVTDFIAATNLFLMPEEPLEVLQGERALGDWTLEVWDTRAGPGGLAGGTLLGWELQLKYGNPAGRAEALTNGVVTSGIISGNITNYFVVDVCESVNVAFATLIGPFNKLNLLVSRSGFPTGRPEVDEFRAIRNRQPLDEEEIPEMGLASFTLTTDPHQPAPLLAGGRLFFAVHNLQPDETNTFDFQVSFDNDTCSGDRPIIRLENNVAFTNVVAPSSALLDYYVFNVSPIAVAAEFEVRPSNGDVGLVLSHGLPLPTLDKFDLRSDRPGITNELIVLTNGAAPVSLQSGDWYLGVYNNSTNAVVYDVRASEILDTNINVITLTNTLPVNFTIAQNAGLTNFFLFKVLVPQTGVKFELYDLNAEADLFIGYNILPSPTAYLLSNSASPVSPITVEIRTNASLPTVTGNWMLQVVNRDPTTNLTFTLRASYIQLTNAPPTGTNRFFDPTMSVSATDICFSWPATAGLQYQLQGLRTLSETNWTTLFGPVTATNALMTFCLGLPSEYTFFRVGEIQPGTTPPPGPGEASIIDPSMTVSTNNICLTWPSQVGTSYQVQGRPDLFTGGWTNVGALIVATATTSSYCVTLPTSYIYFQVVENPGGTTPPPASGAIIDPALNFGPTGLCLTWPSQAGLQYDVQGRLAIGDSGWTNIIAPVAATGPSTTQCLPANTPYHFFQIVTRTTGGTGTGGGVVTNGPALRTPSVLSDGRLQLVLDGEIGASYEVQFATNLQPVVRWTTLTNITAAGASTTITDASRVTGSGMRFYRILKR